MTSGAAGYGSPTGYGTQTRGGAATRRTRRAPVAIVGAGLAGAATGAALSRRGVPVIVFEAETTTGRHSSGRSAGLIRQAVEDPFLARLSREGAAAIRARGVPFDETGSILIDPLATIPAEVWAPLPHRAVSAAELESRIPWLAGADLVGAIETEDDGIVDVVALLESYLSEIRVNGGEIRVGEAALRPLLEDARVMGIETCRETIAIEDLVIATGAWGGEWGERGGVPIALTPTRRSLVGSGLPAALRGFPWVWHLDEQWYFRAGSGGSEGLLWCAGEELPDIPGEALPDPRAPGRITAMVARHLPAVRGMVLGRHGAGHRTFCPDRRFLLGPDPRVRGWHWAVGVGGHGVTASFAIGERVANAIVEGSSRVIEPELAWREAVVPTPTRSSSDSAQATRTRARTR